MLQTLLAGVPSDPRYHVAALPHTACPSAPGGLLATQVMPFTRFDVLLTLEHRQVPSATCVGLAKKWHFFLLHCCAPFQVLTACTR